MAFDFPSNPVLDQIYTSGGAVFAWNGYAWVTSGPAVAGDPSDFVLKAGDVMSGLLTLSGDPSNALHAATKQYVDSRGMPSGGAQGQAIVANASGLGTWGAPIDGGSF